MKKTSRHGQCGDADWFLFETVEDEGLVQKVCVRAHPSATGHNFRSSESRAVGMSLLQASFVDSPKNIEKTLGDLSVVLMKEPPCARLKDTEGPASSCLGLEERRPLTPGERRRGWSVRPFDAYDDQNLCNACSAYWHVTVAQVRLSRLG